MKYLIASDIHGSGFYAKKVLEMAQIEKADKIILLGDIYNHGPRNQLPKDYNPIEVSKLLNDIKDQLIVIKGNCDSEVDTMISDFDFINQLVLVVEDKTIFLTHGHVYNIDNLPKTNYNALVYGHFHTGFIKEKDGIICVNAGSTSLPKNDTPNSYLVLDGKEILLKDFDGKVIDSKVL